MASTVVLLAGLGLSRDDTDEGTLLLSLKLPNDLKGVATSSAFFWHVLVTTRLQNNLTLTDHREGLDCLALAECESALRQHVHREYLLTTVNGRKDPANLLVFKHDGWPGLAVWGPYSQLKCRPMDTMETPE